MEQKEPVITYDHLSDEYENNTSESKQHRGKKIYSGTEKVLFFLEEALIIALMMTMIFML
jgi:hypothetical protein